MARVTIFEALQRASELHRVGELGQAEQLYRLVLHHEPGNAEAMHGVGMIAYQVGKPEVAVEWMGRAVAHRGDVAIYQNNYAEALASVGRFQEAVAAAEAALRVDGNMFEAHNTLGKAMKGRGEFESARRAFERAIELRPERAEPKINLGNLLVEMGSMPDGVVLLGEA